jgi:hypothetical protein
MDVAALCVLRRRCARHGSPSRGIVTRYCFSA